MLFFLSIAAKQGFRVDTYTDNAVGVIEKNQENRQSMTRVTLRPDVTFSGGTIPTREQLEKIHHLSHESCFIANSVKTEVITEVI